MPWFVAHGAAMPPAHALDRRVLAAVGAALLILVVTKGFGVAGCGRPPAGFWWCWCCFFTAWAPSSASLGLPPPSASFICSTAPIPRARSPSGLRSVAPADETVAVFHVRRDIEFGLSFYRNREVVNYDEDGVPDEQHMLVARVQGRHGVDLDTQMALEELLEGRQYEQLFSWPEQGLEIYLVGASESARHLQLGHDSWQSDR